MSLLFLISTIFSLTLTSNSIAQQQNGTASCPLDFTVLNKFGVESSRSDVDLSMECNYIRQGLRLVQSHYLQLNGSFLPPLESAEACWIAYQSGVNRYLPNFDIRKSCGFQTSWISQGCMNIITKTQFVSLIPNATLDDVATNCNQSLENNSPCASCTTSLSRLQVYLTGPSVGNVSDCTAYPFIYAAAFANQFGPTDTGTAKCLFSLDLTSVNSGEKKKRNVVILVVLIGSGIGLLAIIVGAWFLCHRHERLKMKQREEELRRAETDLGSALESFDESTTLVKFTLEAVKKATRNFSRENLIGRGGYGNVYKGVLPDGSEVAFKRFKNFSAMGDANFAHEVEVIASVRHVNLVALRGYCIDTTSFQGHQRIIVCDLMKNGSLHDHLFGAAEMKLSWPIRQKIALGTARGLAYLHSGAQPGIIHRDIKGSNILLDERFEPKVADFGLAKFTPEGMTHLSTRVAGTMGYVAPEYALYGQLTERSDVYSFGVVFLELLSGKKALLMTNENQPSLVTDWAWSLVRKGRALDVIEEGMPELGTPEVLEKYVLVAVLCSHPQLYARPTMDQVVKMLETDISVPSIPERPIPIVSEMDDIERSVSTSGSGHIASYSGYQPFTFESDFPSGHKEDGEHLDSVRIE
ncbi:LRR receptor-like serine/threonine-protein kinase RKF3 [Tripterygium wilfordii]|uniref:non-specific serine/threonine protein kinase n=1 Tax=Tripterygium wilfordii TaxID=458696 RepID=A0A7J7CEZ6_TRIWF|nr:probable LRR receptor-like serine/threonine-protein kinase RKF3 [Tripterygium wilfordii]XP_038681203.1 probable LRR receptor-like serine/threonine-protein kinase RKF3 [Tripterygium wilfordii]KAF5732731.1 LRR receptor-like serine/threonine-protein kinase RKF3 [Tripterygium wilfordii]